MTLLYKNNASSRLKVNTDAASLVIQVYDGEGANFPQPAAPGDYFSVTLDDRRTNQIEICRCTARSGDFLTVTRADEGTLAQNFLAGAVVANRFTAGTLTEILNASGYTKAEADAKFVDAAGDIMSGALTLSAVPPAANHAITKAYVDAAVAPKLGEAPTDGAAYGRKSGIWAAVVDVLTYTASDVLAKLLTVDGAGSNLDADLLDGQQGSFYATAAGVDALDDRVSDVEQKNIQQDVAISNTYSRGESDSRFINIDGDQMAGPLGLVEPPTSAADAVTKGYVDTQVGTKLGDAPSDGLVYGRKNAAWATVIGGAATSDAPPAPPLQDGQLWWDSDSGNTYIWYDDGNTQQWVQQSGNPDASGLVSKSGDIMTGLLQLSGAPTAALHAATKAYADGVPSFAGNGYQKLPSGLIIQWGNATSGAADFTITFPIAFTAYCAAAIANIIGAPGAAGGYMVSTASNTVNNFVVYRRTVSGGTVGGLTGGAVGWIALGW